MASFAVNNIDRGVRKVVLSSRWWADAGVHAHDGTAVFTLANLLMLAAAVVAGYKIVVSALRALAAKMMSIDLLVSVAAIGAIIIGNF